MNDNEKLKVGDIGTVKENSGTLDGAKVKIKKISPNSGGLTITVLEPIGKYKAGDESYIHWYEFKKRD